METETWRERPRERQTSRQRETEAGRENGDGEKEMLNNKAYLITPRRQFDKAKIK